MIFKIIFLVMLGFFNACHQNDSVVKDYSKTPIKDIRDPVAKKEAQELLFAKLMQLKPADIISYGLKANLLTIKKPIQNLANLEEINDFYFNELKANKENVLNNQQIEEISLYEMDDFISLFAQLKNTYRVANGMMSYSFHDSGSSELEPPSKRFVRCVKSMNMLLMILPEVKNKFGTILQELISRN